MALLVNRKKNRDNSATKNATESIGITESISVTKSGGGGGGGDVIEGFGSQGGTLTINQTEIDALPSTGAAFTAMKAMADSNQVKNLSDQNSFGGISALAKAFVYAKTNNETYRTGAQNDIRAIIGTEQDPSSSVGDARNLAVARTLVSYVLAADIIKMDNNLTGTRAGYTNVTWWQFLNYINDLVLPDPHGGSTRWTTLRIQHMDTSHNFGTMAGSSVLAVDRYLNKTTEFNRAAEVTMRWLGDRTKHTSYVSGNGATYTNFKGPGWGSSMDPSFISLEPGVAQSTDADKLANYVGINPQNAVGGITYNGLPPSDLGRDGTTVSRVYDGNYGNIDWDHGGDYTYASISSVALAMIIIENSGVDIWSASNNAMLRACQWLDRAGQFPGNAAGLGNHGDHMGFLIDAKYGTSMNEIPYGDAAWGRQFGFTDWIYGP